MIRDLEIGRLARKEYDEAADWYEARRKGLGNEYISAVRFRLRTITSHPERFAVVYGDVREALVKRFPYVVYFRVLAERILILAIIHTSRDPQEWQRRV